LGPAFRVQKKLFLSNGATRSCLDPMHRHAAVNCNAARTTNVTELRCQQSVRNYTRVFFSTVYRIVSSNHDSMLSAIPRHAAAAHFRQAPTGPLKRHTTCFVAIGNLMTQKPEAMKSPMAATQRFKSCIGNCIAKHESVHAVVRTQI